MMRKIGFAALVAGAVIVGMLAQAGSYLLELTPSGGETPSDAGPRGPFARGGPHDVGLRSTAPGEAPVPMTIWYPASPEGEDRLASSYSYGINMFGPETSLAVAIFDGYAQVAAAPDLSRAPYPLVVLSHGFAITPSSYGWLAEHLASHGFVVVAPRHSETLDPRMLWRSTIERPRDLAAVLAHAEEGSADDELGRLIDPESVAVIGHSYGGYTALAAAGARMDTNSFTEVCDAIGDMDDPLLFLCDALLPQLPEMAALAGLDTVPSSLWPALSEGRVDAVVSIAGDAAMFTDSGLAEVKVPVMAIGGTADTDSPFPWGTQLTYEGVASERKVEVAFEGAGHMVFAGGCDRVRRVMSLAPLGFCSDPVWGREETHALVKHYVTTFLLAELQQDRSAAATLGASRESFPGIGYRAEGY